MKIVTNYYGKLTDSSKEAKDIAENRVYFVTEDGRAMFEITICKDQRSIEVRGVDTCNIDGTLYSCSLSIEPSVSNTITVRTVPYE